MHKHKRLKMLYEIIDAITAPNGVARNYLEALVMRIGQ